MMIIWTRRLKLVKMLKQAMEIGILVAVLCYRVIEPFTLLVFGATDLCELLDRYKFKIMTRISKYNGQVVLGLLLFQQTMYS